MNCRFICVLINIAVFTVVFIVSAGCAKRLTPDEALEGCDVTAPAEPPPGKCKSSHNSQDTGNLTDPCSAWAASPDPLACCSSQELRLLATKKAQMTLACRNARLRYHSEEGQRAWNEAYQRARKRSLDFGHPSEKAD